MAIVIVIGGMYRMVIVIGGMYRGMVIVIVQTQERDTDGEMAPRVA
jgi:hypothetical protein